MEPRYRFTLFGRKYCVLESARDEAIKALKKERAKRKDWSAFGDAWDAVDESFRKRWRPTPYGGDRAKFTRIKARRCRMYAKQAAIGACPSGKCKKPEVIGAEAKAKEAAAIGAQASPKEEAAIGDVASEKKRRSIPANKKTFSQYACQSPRCSHHVKQNAVQNGQRT